MTTQYPTLFKRFPYTFNYHSNLFKQKQNQYQNNLKIQTEQVQTFPYHQTYSTNPLQHQQDLNFIAKHHELKQIIDSIPDLNVLTEQLLKQIYILKIDNEKIEQAAIEAIIEKQNLIIDLQCELKRMREKFSTKQVEILEEKYDDIFWKFQQLEEQNQKYQYQLKQKKKQIQNLCQNIESLHKQYENRIVKLEMQNNYKYQCDLQQVIRFTKLRETSLLQQFAIIQNQHVSKIQQLESKNSKILTELQHNIIKYQKQIQMINKKNQQHLNELLMQKDNQYNIKIKQFQMKYDQIQTNKNNQILQLQITNTKLQQTLNKLHQTLDDLQFQKQNNIQGYCKYQSKQINTPTQQYQISQFSNYEYTKSIKEGIDQMCQLQQKGYFKFQQWRSNKGIIPNTKISAFDLDENNLRNSNLNNNNMQNDLIINSTFNSVSSCFLENNSSKKQIQNLKQEFMEMLNINGDQIKTLKQNLDTAQIKIQHLNKQIAVLMEDKKKLQQCKLELQQKDQKIKYLRQRNLKQKMQYSTKIVQLTDQKAAMELKIHKLENSKSTTSTNPFKSFFNF